tara:strand:- start:238 stop:729 length:492 start_codon:yes stop_codon:yes gene_type:complete
MASLSTAPTYRVQLELPNNINLTNNLYKQKISEGNLKKDSGFDLFCPEDVEIQAGEIKLIDMKVKCAVYKNSEPSAYYMYSRSSTPIKYGLILGNSVGIIDSGYRGNLMASFYNTKKQEVKISAGTRLVQICMPDLSYDFDVDIVDSLNTTARGEGGFGSTGE